MSRTSASAAMWTNLSKRSAQFAICNKCGIVLWYAVGKVLFALIFGIIIANYERSRKVVG
jgi:hypothetical protein